jgi:3',5'-cyclic-AMP phosphodiesterase
MIFAQLSDPHVAASKTEFHDLYGTQQMLEKALQVATDFTSTPELIFITGDLVNSGSDAEYAILKNILKDIEIPVYLGIGNHDCRSSFQKAFSHLDYIPQNGFVQYAVEHKGLRFLMLDTNIPNKPQGELCADRLKWLDDRLSEKPDMPTVVFMHHPPFITGIKAMDDMGFLHSGEFAALIEKYSHIVRISCGHLHRSIQSTVGGVSTTVCPSTSHSVMLHLEADSQLATTNEPAEIQFHKWSSTGELVTHSYGTSPHKIMWKLKGKRY